MFNEQKILNHNKKGSTFSESLLQYIPMFFSACCPILQYNNSGITRYFTRSNTSSSYIDSAYPSRTLQFNFG
jgi:hypothetical protein